MIKKLSRAAGWLREGLAELRASLADTFTGLPGKLRRELDRLRFRDSEPPESDEEFIASVAPMLPPAATAEITGKTASCECPLPYAPGGPVPCIAAGRCMRPADRAPADPAATVNSLGAMFAERIRIMGAAPANADTSSTNGAAYEPWSAPVMILAGAAPDGRPWLWLACRGCGWFLGFAEQYVPAELAKAAADHAAGCEALAPYEECPECDPDPVAPSPWGHPEPDRADDPDEPTNREIEPDPDGWYDVDDPPEVTR
jgi:hypothetical protein